MTARAWDDRPRSARRRAPLAALAVAILAGSASPASGQEDSVATSTPPPPPTVPAGTRLVARTESPLDSRASRSGDRFTARLEGAIVVDGVQVFVRGARLHGRVVEARAAGRVRGRALLVIELTDIALGDELLPITTDRFAVEGDRSGTLRMTGTATLIGAVVEGDDGAATGAAIGGAVSLLTPGRQIRLPPGTLLEFRTTQPLSPRRPDAPFE